MDLLWALIVGLIAGALAGVVVKGRGFGILGDTIVGLVGGLIGGFLFRSFGAGADSILGSILVAFVGAVILLLIVKMTVGGTGGGKRAV